MSPLFKVLLSGYLFLSVGSLALAGPPAQVKAGLSTTLKSLSKKVLSPRFPAMAILDYEKYLVRTKYEWPRASKLVGFVVPIPTLPLEFMTIFGASAIPNSREIIQIPIAIHLIVLTESALQLVCPAKVKPVVLIPMSLMGIFEQDPLLAAVASVVRTT